jgi:hypothetical protein
MTTTSFVPNRSTTAGELTRLHIEGESLESANPTHYGTGNRQAIHAIRSALGEKGFIDYCRGQVIRYTWRMGKKDDTAVEAEKIAVYIQWIRDTLAGRELTVAE